MPQMLSYIVNDHPFTISVESSEGVFLVTVNEREYRVTAKRGPESRLDLNENGKRTRTYVAQTEDSRLVAVNGEMWTVRKQVSRPAQRATSAGTGGLLSAAMPGLVLDVLVETGVSVKKGETLVLLEAMKMELRISSPVDGRVTGVHCRAGEVVDRGRQLVTVQATEPG